MTFTVSSTAGNPHAFGGNKHNWGQDDDVLSDVEGKALLKKLLR